MAHKTAPGPRGGTYHPSALSVDDPDSGLGDTEVESSRSSTEVLSSISEELSSSVYDETNQQFLIRGLAEKRKAKGEGQEQENGQGNQEEQQEAEDRQEEEQEDGARARQTTPPGKKRKRSG